MQKAMKKKWLKALRSGEYEQCDGKLVSDDDRFCCLGVLCNISNAGFWYKDKMENEWAYSYDRSTSVMDLPHKLRQKLDVPESIQGRLIHMNDIESSFSEIADWIEENM